MMEKDLVVIAEPQEIQLLDKIGLMGHRIFITGVGALNVMEALKDFPRDTHIINVGYAGSKDLPVKRFYLVSFCTLNHPNVNYTEPTYDLRPKGFNSYKEMYELEEKVCYTGCDFVTQSKIPNCLFDMELAYIKGLGFGNVTAFKYVSDNLDLQEYRKTAKENQ